MATDGGRERRMFTGIGPIPSDNPIHDLRFPELFSPSVPLTPGEPDHTYRHAFVTVRRRSLRTRLVYPEIAAPDPGSADTVTETLTREEMLAREIAQRRNTLSRLKARRPGLYATLGHIDDIRWGAGSAASGESLPVESVSYGAVVTDPPLLLEAGAAYADRRRRKRLAAAARTPPGEVLSYYRQVLDALVATGGKYSSEQRREMRALSALRIIEVMFPKDPFSERAAMFQAADAVGYQDIVPGFSRKRLTRYLERFYPDIRQRREAKRTRLAVVGFYRWLDTVAPVVDQQVRDARSLAEIRTFMAKSVSSDEAGKPVLQRRDPASLLAQVRAERDLAIRKGWSPRKSYAPATIMSARLIGTYTGSSEGNQPELESDPEREALMKRNYERIADRWTRTRLPDAVREHFSMLVVSMLESQYAANDRVGWLLEKAREQRNRKDAGGYLTSALMEYMRVNIPRSEWNNVFPGVSWRESVTRAWEAMKFPFAELIGIRMENPTGFGE